VLSLNVFELTGELYRVSLNVCSFTVYVVSLLCICVEKLRCYIDDDDDDDDIP
jgi:hypothetical protein